MPFGCQLNEKPRITPGCLAGWQPCLVGRQLKGTDLLLFVVQTGRAVKRHRRVRNTLPQLVTSPQRESTAQLQLRFC